ncbi:MAG: 30S ribosomal protein S16 [Rickettsiales bacterium]|jgi:small subunit ribosomal protein S16|nr:30S ribosomal protein S16 [Rickettsiales bacterium]
MAVVIRLQRHGAKKNPYYHIVALNSRERRDSGNVLEVLGKYDPMQPKESDKRIVFNADKVKAWLGKGAKASDRVYKFLAAAGLVAKREIPNQPIKSAPSEKTLAKLKAREEKLAKAKEASAAPATEPAAPVETPAAEPAPEAASAEAPAA